MFAILAIVFKKIQLNCKKTDIYKFKKFKLNFITTGARPYKTCFKFLKNDDFKFQGQSKVNSFRLKFTTKDKTDPGLQQTFIKSQNENQL